MQKLMKILAFISLGIIALSFTSLMLCYVFWGPLVELSFDRGAVLPRVIPAGNAVALVGQLGAVIWLCICVCDRRFGVWAELLAAGWLGAVLPLLGRVLASVETLIIRNVGLETVTARSYASLVWSYATVFNSVAVALSLVICGMSLADKLLHRNSY